MPIEFACPSCGQPQRADDRLAGRTLRCADCKATFTVPGSGAPEPPGRQSRPAEPEPAPLKAAQSDSIFD
jgi:ribosomal protein L37AE/L43A